MTNNEDKKAYMREYARKRRAKAIEQKLCPGCMKSDERIENGYTYCAKCAERYRSYWYKYEDRENKKAQRREYARKMRAWAKEHRICVACGAKDERTENGYTCCTKCAEKYRNYYRHKKESKNEQTDEV